MTGLKELLEAAAAGPWFISGPFIGPRLSKDSGIQIKVARVSGLGDGLDDETNANAALIALAPTLASENIRLREALRACDDAIKEMFRYYDGGETRGSYDGKPERNQLRKAGYAASAALSESTVTEGDV